MTLTVEINCVNVKVPQTFNQFKDADENKARFIFYVHGFYL